MNTLGLISEADDQIVNRGIKETGAIACGTCTIKLVGFAKKSGTPVKNFIV